MTLAGRALLFPEQRYWLVQNQSYHSTWLAGSAFPADGQAVAGLCVLSQGVHNVSSSHGTGIVARPAARGRRSWTSGAARTT